MPGVGDAEPTVQEIPLPEARSGAAAVAVSDGIVVAGGLGPGGQPTATVWKATLDPKTGVLGEFKHQPNLLHAGDRREHGARGHLPLGVRRLDAGRPDRRGPACRLWHHHDRDRQRCAG